MGRGDSYQLQGQQGFIALNAASGATTGSWRWVYFPADTVLADIQGNITNPTIVEGNTHLAGTGFGGEFTALQVTSGTVYAYYK